MKTVKRSGLLFKVGNYPDKKFSLTGDEMDRAVELFSPVAANSEHGPHELNGKIGGLSRVWKQGDSLFGEVTIPEWLHEFGGGKPLKPSLEWNRATKTISGIAYTKNPRISDAALMAAFSAAEEAGEVDSVWLDAPDWTANFGKTTEVQSLHDSACRYGAECPGKSLFSDDDKAADRAVAAFMTPESLKAIQKVHDEMAKSGADCDLYATRNGMWGFSADLTDFTATGDAPPKTSPPILTGDKPLDKKTVLSAGRRLLAQFGVGQNVTDDQVIAAFDGTNFSVSDAELNKTVDPNVTALQAQVALLQQDKIRDNAAAFADVEIAASRALPTERIALQAAFSQAANDDLTHPTTVTFAEGTETKTGTRVDLLKATHKARPAHLMGRELSLDGPLPENAISALFNRNTTQIDVVKSAEEQGKTYAAQQNGTNNGTGGNGK